MSKALPERPDLSWLRRRAKQLLGELRTRRPAAKLAEAQLQLAREYGFASWRALKQHVDAQRRQATAATALPEAEVARFLEHVGRGDTAAVTAMLAEQPALVNAVGPHPFWGGRPQPLHVALDANRDDMVQLLLRAGADVDGDNEGYSHWSPLLLALQKQRHRARRALLRRGARVGVAEALLMGDDATVMRLLARGRAALPQHTPGDGSLLVFARTPAAIDRLLALGVPVDVADRWGATPMEALSRNGTKGAPLVRHLAGRGVPVDAQIWARIADRRALARLFASDPAAVRHDFVIKAAVDFGHRALVSWLLDRGADPNARSDRESRDTCLHSAAWNGDAAMVELLLARGADPRLRDAEHDGTPADFAEYAAVATNNPACEPLVARLRQAEAEHPTLPR
ncbi:MAG: ankyrin repeat domain-containing protein [Nannocystaceae bacterium]|nr:ankyrin repeat domain-containing protein [Nannocystaceae bacterium]